MHSLWNLAVAAVGVALAWVAILHVDSCAGPVAMTAALMAFAIAAVGEWRLARAAPAEGDAVDGGAA